MGEVGAEFDLCVIVDDDEDILTAARLLLRGLFREVATAVDARRSAAAARGAVARRRAARRQFRARRDRRGERACAARAAARRSTRELIVVMITAHAGVNVAVEAMKRGATDFVSKPWSNERLLADRAHRRRAQPVAPRGGAARRSSATSPGTSRR